MIEGEGEGDGDADGDGLGDGDGDGEGLLDFLGLGFCEAELETETGGPAGTGVVDPADGSGETFFLSFFCPRAGDGAAAEDDGGCTVTRCSAASGWPGELG